MLSIFLVPLHYVKANENIVKHTETKTQPGSINAAFTIQPSPENQQDIALLKKLDETKTFERIKSIMSANFILSKPVQLHIQNMKELISNPANQEINVHTITLPFNFLHTLYQSLLNKYEHQSETINSIFSASVEFYFWSEFADYLIKDKPLEIAGDSFATKDNFASIMLLNQNNSNSDFITDASEAYLLIRQTTSSTLHQHSQNELQLDQFRFKHIVCLTLGFDQIMQNPEIERFHLKSFSWDENSIENCKAAYLSLLDNWYQALGPMLKKGNTLSHWLNQRRLFQTKPL